MSISIILDKSSFQMLNPEEINMLHNYFLPNITPVLVMEVLGDLKKDESEGKSSKESVVKLARKLLPHNSAVNIHYSKLIEMDLLGDMVNIDNRPIVGEITTKESTTGLRGFHIEDSAEEKALGKWRTGEFSTTDELVAKLWREVTTQKDILENLQQQLKKGDAGSPPLKSLQEVKNYVDQIMADPQNQTGILKFCIAEFGISAESAAVIFARWEQQPEKKFSSFAPYAFYCCLVKLFFYIGLKNHLIGTRPTNHVDLQYLYYLPFCLIFSSNDKFHKSVIELLVGERHTFISGDQLKKGLQEAIGYRSTLSERKDIDRTLKEPPRVPDFIIYKLWNKYLAWPPKFERKISDQEIEEQKKKIDEFIAASDTPGMQDAIDNPDFVVKKYFITLNDPCPCGSGKKFAECHHKQQ